MNSLTARLLSKGPVESMERIGPDEAKALILAAPHTNRIRPSTLTWWIETVTSGEIPASPPLRLDYDGRLSDGWHRLLAVVFTGQAATFPTKRG